MGKVILRIAKLMGLVEYYLVTEIYMKENLKMDISAVMVLWDTEEWRTLITTKFMTMKESIMAIGKWVEEKDKEECYGKIEVNLKEFGKKI